jgi:hypothetical protein
MTLRALCLVPLLLLLSACASSSIDMDEPKRLLGREENVRLDAEILSDRIFANQNIALRWEIQNFRDQPIAVADLIPMAEYDPSSRTITVSLGSEVPGSTMVPRLVVIQPGERKSFSGGARTNFAVPRQADPGARPDRLRIRVNYLRDIEPFRELIGLTERVIADPALADRLFPAWVEANDSVTTNAIPIGWGGVRPDPTSVRRRSSTF